MADNTDKPAPASPAAMAYARSLLELANERGQAQQVGEEVHAISQVMAENPRLKELLSNPSITSADRLGLLDKVFKGQVSDLVYNLIRVANSKGRAGVLDEIAAAFSHLLDAQLGKVDVQVTTAQELDSGQEEAIRARVSQLLGKNAILHKHVDDSIIGGLVVRVGDKVLDGSVKTQLLAMRERLVASGV